MEILKITENDNNVANIVYMYSGLSEVLSGMSRNFSAYNDGSRSVLEIESDTNYGELLRAEIIDKISDIIAVNYKYNMFAENVRPHGLGDAEKEILLAALISADIDDDKAYIKRKINGEQEFSVDGLYNFRLAPLKKKWKDVVSYIPLTFDSEKLKDFISFILEEKRGQRVFVENGKVFDVHFRRMNRAFLTGKVYGDEKLLIELLLSGCGEAELLSAITPSEEEFLREYFGGKIIFGKTYFCN